MCGIFCSLSMSGHILPDDKLADRLRSRGPDRDGTITLVCPTATVMTDTRPDEFTHVTLFSTVLGLRGSSTTPQPYGPEDVEYSLCWNGEAWSIGGRPPAGNDTTAIYDLLVDAIEGRPNERPPIRAQRLSNALSRVAGPHAFVFYDHARGHLYFGRDFLGRRSLLARTTQAGDLILSSVSGDEVDASWSEVEADGVCFVDLREPVVTSSPPQSTPRGFTIHSVPYNFLDSQHFQTEGDNSVIPQLSLSKNIQPSIVALNEFSPAIADLEALLRDSLAIRVLHIPEPPSPRTDIQKSERTKLAILFSGGLDCSVLARICHDLLPLSEPIDLLNVAFENPRIHKKTNVSGLGNNEVFELCPDRVTGRASFAELQRICPGREWRFIAINIPYVEHTEHRETIISLMQPHNTEMDLSIAGALYFAARAHGSSARVLLSGLGADELFAGYTRHARAFDRYGYVGLLDELELDVSRLGKRNLGRDDRVMSHWGKEVRYPYLDEKLLTWALSTSITDKCDFGLERPQPRQSSAVQSSDDLEPGKKVLRCLAWKLGMKQVAREKKRAVRILIQANLDTTNASQIQFGARTAKMETGKTKGTHVLT